MQSSTQQYELTFILDEKAGAEEGKAKTAELKKYIEKAKGTVSKEEQWGRRDLAYIIKGNRSGFYVTLWFDFPVTELPALDRQLRFDESIIRSLVTKAYTSAQPGTLYPVVEGEKNEKPASSFGKDKEEKSSAEEMLRRSSTTSKKEKAVPVEDTEEVIPEEERLKKLDETLDALLKDEE